MNIKRNSTRILTGLAGILLALTAICSVPEMRAEAATTTTKLVTSYIGSCPSGYSLTKSGSVGTGSSSGCYYYKFTNTSYSESVYIKYPQAVVFGKDDNGNEARYDLWIYPWIEKTDISSPYYGVYYSYSSGSDFSSVSSLGSKCPGIFVNAATNKTTTLKLKMIVKKSDGTPIRWAGFFGFSDIDGNDESSYEYCGFPNGSLASGNGRHVGSRINKNESYSATTTVNNIAPYASSYEIFTATGKSSTQTHIWDDNAVYGNVTIPKEGLDILYAAKGKSRGSVLDFSDYVNSSTPVPITVPSYYLEFNGNGNTGGSVPSTIKFEFDTTKGDIGSATPTKTGYIFRGWSSKPECQTKEKRITYLSSQVGGSGYATVTSSSWDIYSYLSHTDGEFTEYGEDLKLTLYSQWEKDPTIYSSVSDKRTAYTGAPIAANSVSVTTPSSGYTIKYGTSYGSYTLSSPPSWTNAGTYTVYYQIAATGYNTKTGSYGLIIDQIPGSVTSSDQSTTYPDTKQISYSRTGDGTISATSSNTNVVTVTTSNGVITATPKSPGTTTITISQAVGTNYTAASKSITFTVNEGKITATASNKSADYTGSLITATDGVTVSSPAECRVTYSKNASSYFSDRPKWIDADTYTVYYKITKTYYTTFTGSYTFTINKIPDKITASDQSTTYPESKAMAYSHIGDGTITLSSSDTSVATVSGTTVVPKKVGSTNIIITSATGTNHTGTSKTIKFTVNPGKVTPPTVKTGLIYNGSTQTGVPAETGYSVTNGSKSGAGNYTATVKLNDKTNFVWSDTNDAVDKTLNWSIAPLAVTPPTPKSGLIYDGTEQTGVVSADTDKYTVGGIYKATSAGEHIATVALTSTTNYKWSDNTTANKSISWTIAKASIDIPTSTDYVYDGTEKTGVPAGNGYIRDGKYISTLAGDYTATVTPDSNHKWTDGSTASKDIAWSIAKAVISIPVGTDYEFDGTEKTGVPAGDGYVRDGKYTATLAGDYTATVTPDSNHIWDDKTTGTKSIVWHITTKQIEVTTTKRSLVYTGNPLTAPNGVTVTKPDDYRIEFGKEENSYTGMPSYTEAGSYTVYFRVTADNYDDYKGSYEFEIEEKGIHVPKAVSLTYNGEEQTGVPEGTGYTITGNTGTNAGSYTAVATPIKNYKWYSGTGPKNISWSIARKPVSEPVSISGLVYDGTLKTGVTNGTGYTVTDNTGTDAGSYTAKANLDSNYQWDSGSNTTATRDIPWSIEKAVGSVTINADEMILTYPADGTFTFSVVGDGTVSASVGDTSIVSASLAGNTVTTHPVNVGESTAIVTKSAGKNYKAASASIPVRVDPGTIHASSTKQTGYYNGSAITPAGITVAEPTNATVMYSETTVRTRAVPVYTLSSPPSLTNAGSYNILYQVTAPNYAPLTGSYDVDINKANISVEVPHTKVTYDGSSKQADGIRVLDPASGAVVKYGTQAGSYDLDEAPSFTEAGEHMVYYKVTAENYNNLTGSYKFEILPANMIVRVKNDTKVYTGNEITPAPVELLYPKEGTIKYGTVEGSYTLDAPKAYTNVGVYTVYYKVTADNFNDKEGSYTLEITAKPISVPSAVSGLTYNGEVQTGVLSGDGYTVTGNTGKDASSYTATVTPDSNHKWSDGSVTGKTIDWSIARKPVPVPVAVNGLTYNGSEQTGVATGEGYDLSGNKAVNAGNYTATAVLSDNYRWMNGSLDDKEISWNIARKSVAVPGKSDYVYDGMEKTGVENGAEYTLLGDMKGTNAGSYTVTAKVDDNHVWEDGKTEDKTLVWKIAPKSVNVPKANTGLIYDGTEKIGVDAGTEYNVTGNKAVNAGNYTATVSIDNNHIWDDGTNQDKEIFWSVASGVITLSVNNMEYVYDGTAHTPDTVTVTYPGTGYTVKYGKEYGTYDLDAPLTYTSAGVHNIYYQITADNFATVKGYYTLTITRKAVDAPVAVTSLTYNGNPQTGVPSGAGFSLTDNIKINAGSYTAVAKLDDNHKWSDNTIEDKSIEWGIERDVPVLTAPDHYITYPDEITISYLSNSDGTVTAVSSDETIVIVDNGVIVPVKAGKTEITLNQAATNNFTAATKTFNVTVSRGKSRIEPIDDMEITYPEEVSVSVTRVGNGALTVTSSNENVATVSMNGLDLMIKSITPGKAIITLEQAESGQSEYASAMFVLTVKSGAFEAEPKKFRNLEYTGQPMEIGRVDVTAPTDPNGNEVPYDIFYKSDVEDDWSETMPVFVNAGVHTVWYKIFADNYEDLTGSFEGTIKKADSVLTLADITIPYDGYDHAFTYGSIGGGDITVKTLSGNQLAKVTPSVIESNEDVNGGKIEIKDIKGTGKMVLKISMSDTQNWNSTEKTVNISITEKTYTVSIDTGESVIVKTYAYGGTITLPEITKAGNTFKGWHDGDRFITSDMTDEIDVPAKDTVISAKWEPNSYIVEFDPNGGRGSIKSQERVYGDRVELPSHEGFKYKAHAFSHWNTKADDTGDKFLDCSIRDISEGEDVTLYAIWTESAVPDESEINEDKALYQVGDRYYIDGSLYICKKDTTDNTSPDEDPEHWVKTGDEETDNTVPFNSDTLTVSGNKMTFDRGDYIYVENSDKKTSDIYVCLIDGTDGSEWLNDNWKRVAQTEAQLIYNTNIIYKQGDTIYKDGSILICNKDGVTGAFRSEHWIQQLILAKAVKAESEESRIGLRHGTKVRAKVLPEDATDKTVVWESLTPDVATVDDEGNVTAISDGIAEIMATASSGVTDSVEIEIYIDLDGMDFTETEGTIREGQEKTMVPVFIPADAEHGDIRWTSTEPGNVSVNENGVIKGLKRGTTSVIEAYCSGKTARCTITVTDPCEVSVVPENIKLYLNGVNEYDLSCVIEPSDAGDIEWKSFDPDVVSVDENGHIRALSLGETDIQATCLGVTDICHVTVEEGQIEGIALDNDYIEVTVRDSIVLTARIIPANAKPGKITWESDDEITLYPGEDKMFVIAVPEKMGVYTVTVREESGVSASCQIRGIEYYDFAKEGNLITSSSEHKVRKIKGSFYCFDSLGRAEAGFITVNGSTYYFDPDTGVAVKGLQEIKGALYFFDKKTCIMVKDNKVKVSGKTYHFGSDGKAVGGVYYLPDKKDSKAWFYFDEDAVMQNGVFPATLAEDGIQRYYHFKNGKLNNPKKDGFQKVNGYRYYVYTDGHVATGIVDIADKKGTKTYCFYEDGRLAVGAVLSGNRLIPVDKDGQIATPKKPGLTKIGCDYYWYNEDGSVFTGWKDVTDKNGAVKATYYFDPATGASASGIRVIDGVKYIFRNGACIRKDSVVTVNKKKYVVRVDGTGHKGCAVMQFGLTTLSNGKTYYTDERTGVIRTGLLTVSDNTLSGNAVCYTSKSGEFQKNKWVKINKKKYHTDSNGVLQTGRTDINGKVYYFDPDSKPAGAMKTGLVTENDSVYLYGTNGVLQTGGKFVSYRGKKYFVDNEGKVPGLNDGYIKVPDSKKGEVTYELGEDGALLNGTKDVDGKLYLYKNGIQILSKPAPKKNIGGVWKTVNKKKYLLGYTDSVSANVCYTGFYTDPKGKGYLFMEDGHMASAELVEVPFGEITDKMTPDADGSYWYYYNKKGQKVMPEMTKGGWYKVSGTRAAYVYDSGCAASGWMNIGGKEYYFDPENGITTVKLSFIERLLWELS